MASGWPLDDNLITQKVDELVVRADAIESADPAFRKELGYWIGQGVFGILRSHSVRSSE